MTSRRLPWMLAVALATSLLAGCGGNEPSDDCAFASLALAPVCGDACTAPCGCGCAPLMTRSIAGELYVCNENGTCFEPRLDADAGAIDAGDAGDGGLADGAIDCSTVGCGLAPICGESCGEPCGCCPCGDGDTTMIEEVEHECVGGCWAEREDLGRACASDEGCGAGLSCCYPCGIPGCEHECTPTCESSSPSCADGCLLVP